MTSSGSGEDFAAAVGGPHSIESSPSAAVVTQKPDCQSSIFSSPVSDLAFNLEVLSTDGLSSQLSSSSSLSDG